MLDFWNESIENWILTINIYLEKINNKQLIEIINEYYN